PSARESTQLTKDLAAMDKYLSDNSISAQAAPFGVKYVMATPSAGPIPGWYNKIRVDYTGRVMGTGIAFFAGAVQPSEGFDSRVVDYLPGLQVAFQILPVGNRATFFIPSVLGFGTQEVKKDGVLIVPANSNLIIEVSSVQLAN